MEFLPILRELIREEVEFIVVGGVGAVLQGVPMSTLDVDIVHARSRENRRRLVRALHSLGACYRGDPQRLAPRIDDLASPDHHLLETRYADFDLLGTIHGGLGYDEILPRSIRVELEPGFVVRVLDLRDLIEVKEAVGRDKDKAQLPLLRATLREREKRGDPWIPPPGHAGT